MNPIFGTIVADDIFADQGLTRRLRISMTVINRNDFVIELASLGARVFVDFSEAGRRSSLGTGQYLAEAFPERPPGVLTPGDGNRLTLLLPLGDDELTAIETARVQRDIVLSFEVSFTGLPRVKNDTATTGPIVSGILTDGRGQSNQYVVTTVAKSRWTELLSTLGYSLPVTDAQLELRRLIEEARIAKEEAESAAKGAKEAAALTAVTSLAQAYAEEARTLKKRSRVWGGIAFIVVALGAYLMHLYARESFRGELSTAATVLRSIILAAVFGVLTLCIRVYESYLHLEVVNRHRVNIGRTFEAFKAAQPTERAREIMAAITAEHMLAFGKSGFAPKDTPNQGPVPALTELIRNLAEKR